MSLEGDRVIGMERVVSTSRRAVGYIRCSTEMQEDSPEQQKREIEQYASKVSLQVIGWFVDIGKSGTTFDQRPEFQRLKAIVDKGPDFEAVICYDESRWGRAIDPEENTYMKVLFRKRKVDVLLVKTSVDHDNEFSPLLTAFESVQASQYSKKLSELVLRGSKSNGIYSSGGTAPYGYRRIAVSIKTGLRRSLGDGEWCVHRQEKVLWTLGEKQEADTVRRIFSERAQGRAMILIAESLNRDGVPCPRRGKWKSLDQKWSQATVKALIENPAYYGARVYNRFSSSKIQARLKGRDFKSEVPYPAWRNSREDWVVVEDAHEPIINKKLWEAANFSSRSVIGSQPHALRHKSRYLLSGLIYCSSCGFAYQGHSKTSRGKKYFSYLDGGWKNKRVCELQSIPQDDLEAFVLNAVRETILNLKLIGKIEEYVEQFFVGHYREESAQRNDIRNAITECDKKITNLASAIENGAALEPIVERLRSLQRDRQELKASLAKTDKRSDLLVDASEIAKAVAAFVLDYEKRFDGARIEDKKQIIRKLVWRIVVDRRENKARVYVRRIPAVSNELAGILETTEPRLAVTNQSARRGT